MRYFLILISLFLLTPPSWAQAETNQTPNQSANQGLGEQLFADITALSSLNFGPADGKNLYVFMDPYCPYCLEFDKAMMAEIAAGRQLRLHVIPAPILGTESQKAVLHIYSADDPSAAWQRFVADGKLPEATAKEDLLIASAQRIKSNFDVMKRWKFLSVPLLVWRGVDGRVMMMHGTPDNTDTVWRSIGLE